MVKIKRNISEAVKIDDLIFEVETDKAVLELTAEASGDNSWIFLKEDV